MQPEKEIDPPKELEAEKPELINVAKQPEPDSNQAQHESESHANELIAKTELEEINEKGISGPVSDNPYFHPNTRSGHLFGGVFFNEKVVGAPNHRLRRFVIGLVIICMFVGLFIYRQHESNIQAKKFTQQFPKLNYSNKQ